MIAIYFFDGSGYVWNSGILLLSYTLQSLVAYTSVMFDMLDHNEADAIITLDSHSYRKDYIIAKEQAVPMHFVANSNYDIVSFRFCYKEIYRIWRALLS